MASSSAPQTRALFSTSVALTAETTSPHTGGCGGATARTVKPKIFIAPAPPPLLFGSPRGAPPNLLFSLFLIKIAAPGEDKTSREPRPSLPACFGQSVIAGNPAGKDGRRSRGVCLDSFDAVFREDQANCQFALHLLLSLRSRGQYVIFFAGRVEGDAALLQIGVLAQVRGQRRTVTADDVGVGQRARLHAIKEVADVLLFKRLGVLALDRGLRSSPAPG